MREIKFRAWDKTNKRMEEIDGGNLYVADNKVYEISEESHYYEVYMSKKDVTERYILTQFTGLHDKNDTAIYEGDILRLWCGKGQNGELRREYPYPLSVTYSDLWCQFVVEDKANKVQYGIWQAFNAFEVIGNIYENPELLRS